MSYINTMSKNNNKLKQWFITYPQSGDETREGLIEKLPPTSYSITCKEAHEDGKPHLHAGIKLKHGISKSNLRKWIEKKFPEACQRIDYHAIRSFTHARNYCKKEDPETVETGSIETIKIIVGRSDSDKADELEAHEYILWRRTH